MKKTLNISFSFLLGLVLMLGALSSCKVTSGLQLPGNRSIPSAFNSKGDTLSVAALRDTSYSANHTVFDTAVLGNLSPQDFFRDPVLRRHIDTALANNQDYKIALQRVEQARGALRSTRGPLMPTVNSVVGAGVDRFGRYTMNGVGNFDSNLSPNVTGNLRIPEPTPDFFLGFRASWEIDLWGKLRNKKQAAANRLLATEEGRNWIKTQLVTEVARHYYMLLGLDAERAIILRNIGLQETTVELVRAQKSGGRSNELGVQQTLGLLLKTRAAEFEINQLITETEARLNLLLGRYNQSVERGDSLMKQRLPQQIHVGIPANTLLRRPDVKAAYHELNASLADADAAQAALYPSFNINPYLGLNAFAVGTLFSLPASIATGLASGLVLPSLNRLSLTGERNVAKSQAVERFHAYERTMLTAYAEAFISMKRIQNYRQVNALRRREVVAQERALTAGNELYMAGYADYLELLTAQRSLVDAELGVALSRKEVMLGLVDLYRALGGGWQ